MTSARISPEAAFLIDFNVYQVPAIVGMDVPPTSAAGMVGVTEAELLAYTADVEAEVNRTAKALLDDAERARAVDRLAVPQSGTMMAVGDSITTYRFGYARLLEAMVSMRRRGDAIRFLNVAQSGYTSSDCLENTFTQFLAEQPDVVFIKLGVNDCKLFGGATAKTLVSLDDYRANMGAIVEAFLEHTPARPVLITPVPVVEGIVNTDPGFQAMRMTWANDDVKTFAGAVQELAQRHGLACVDLVETFGESPDPALFLADGLHPAPAGHRLVLDAVLRALPKG